ncbi:MAG: hypothetical protein Q8J70_10165 [Thiobacillus sp.]|nr:hypothetical protein [Thiobacillus sp.]
MKGLAHACHSNELACYTRTMQILIPHLFPGKRLLEAATQNLRLPALETLLGRGRLQACSADGTEAALCQALGIARQQDWPLAPITLEADGQDAGGAYWLRADPVHLRVMRDRIVLADPGVLNLSQHEADELSASIAQHFGENLNPIALHPQRWYLQLSHLPRLTTTPLSVATGRNIEPVQPQGEAAQHYRALLNELQMLLFTHPVNQARELRGELPVNSVWIWGGGVKPDTTPAALSLYANDPEARALGKYGSAQLHPTPAKLEKSLIKKESVIQLDALTPAGLCGDAYAWREALRAMEQDWFVPLLAALRTVDSNGLQLSDPVNGKSLFLKKTDTWKIWRRPRNLLSFAN